MTTARFGSPTKIIKRKINEFRGIKENDSDNEEEREYAEQIYDQQTDSGFAKSKAITILSYVGYGTGQKVYEIIVNVGLTYQYLEFNRLFNGKVKHGTFVKALLAHEVDKVAKELDLDGNSSSLVSRNITDNFKSDDYFIVKSLLADYGTIIQGISLNSIHMLKPMATESNSNSKEV